MKTNIVIIGNSQGIRIPKILLEQSGLSGEVELEVCDVGLLIRRAKKMRGDWAESFKQMAENNDDELLDEFAPTNLHEGALAMVKRFDIFMLNLDEEVSKDAKNSRLCVVVSPDEMNRYIDSVIVAPVSSVRRKYPTRVLFEFLNKERAVVLDQIKTVEKNASDKKVGEIEAATRKEILETLREMFAE